MNIRRMTPFFNWIFPLLMSLTLFGCNSGGSGAGGNLPEVIYEGKTDRATVTNDNAQKIFTEVWTEGAGIPTLSKGTGKSVARPRGGRNRRLITWTALVTQHIFSSATQEKLSSGKAVNQSISGRVSGRLSFSGDLNEDGTGTVTATYENFDDGDGTRSDGTMILKINKFYFPRSLFLDVEVQFLALKVEDSKQNVTLSGRAHFVTTLESNTQSIDIDTVIRNNLTQGTTKLENFNITTTYDDLLNPSSYSEEISGRLYLETEGYVDVRTETPFEYDDFPQEYPDRGGPLVFEGAGQSQVRVFVHSDVAFRIEVDADGDGEFEVMGIFLWADSSATTGGGEGANSETPGEPAVDPQGAFVVVDLDFPEAIFYGEETKFQIVTTLPASDTVTYRKSVGPNGLQVDLVSGEVTWIPSGPMFEVSTEVHFVFLIESEGEVIRYNGTMTILDPERRAPLVRTGLAIPSAADSIRIADFDGDGVVEILVTDNRNLLYSLIFDESTDSYFQNWVYPFVLGDGDSITAIEAHDINGDGNPEMIVGTGAGIFILDGVSRKILGKIEDGSLDYRSIRVADINKNGRLEIVYLASKQSYSSERTINVYDALDLTLQWQSSVLDLGSSLAIGNVDSDAALEIITAKGYVFDGVSHANEWAYGPGFGDWVDTGDLDNSGVEEIVGAEDWSKVTIFNAVLKTPLWEIPMSDIASLTVANIDADPQAEIIIGDGQWGNVTAYDGLSGSGVEEWSINSQNHGVSSLALGDVDQDGKIEFVWASGATSSGANSLVVAGLNPSIEVEWTNRLISGSSFRPLLHLDGPFVGGRWVTTDDDQKQVIFASASSNNGYDGSRLVAIDPLTSRVEISSELGSNWSGGIALEAVDYDGDGIGEIFLATSSLYYGYFTAYDFAAEMEEWTSASDIGVGQALASGDLNGDGYEDFITLTREGYIYAHDVWNSTLLWKSTQLPGYSAWDLSVADLNLDGVLEIIALSEDTLSVYKKCGSACPADLDAYILASQEILADANNLVIADVDGDGGMDIVVSASDRYGFSSSTSTIWVYDGEGFVQKATYQMEGTITDIAVAPNKTGTKNVYVSILSGDDFYFTVQSRLFELDALAGTEVWRSPLLLGRVQRNSISFADIEEDGSFEVILGTSNAMYISR